VNPVELIQRSLGDSLGSLQHFRPELALAATAVLLLFCRMLPLARRLDSRLIALGGAAFALWYAWRDLAVMRSATGESLRLELFGGLLVLDSLSAFVRFLLAGFLVLYALFTRISGIPDREDGADFWVLVFGATLGMSLMASANHLLMLFMAVEMASVPSYALAGLLKGRRTSSEAALKYVVYGAGAAGVMLYGISLLAGICGTCHLPSMAMELADLGDGGAASGKALVLALGGLMVAVGLAFKLSAVPFHFWAPDVFDGAAAEVGAFLSVASKAAAVALLLRVSLGLTTIVGGDSAGLDAVRHFVVGVIGLMAAATCTLGNLGAYGQTSMKRLLAYSTIAHAGYLMMGAAATVALAGGHPEAGARGVGAIAFYLATYLFMNLCGFALVAVLRNRLRSEQIASYAGLVRSSPGIVVVAAVVLVSLVGLPPLAGFVGKFLVFSSLVEGVRMGADAPLLTALLVVGGLNTVLSLFYYLRVLKVMTFDPPPVERPEVEVPLVSIPGALLAALAVPVLVFGVFWSGLYGLSALAGATVASSAGESVGGQVPRTASAVVVRSGQMP
jgi:NADH-quinone oxidoreductase subunit N